jgi:hypothetical protein
VQTCRPDTSLLLHYDKQDTTSLRIHKRGAPIFPFLLPQKNNRFVDILKNNERISKLPKGQRYANRLGDLLSENILGSKEKRAQRLKMAVEDHGYSQREIADYPGMHFFKSLPNGQPQA